MKKFVLIYIVLILIAVGFFWMFGKIISETFFPGQVKIIISSGEGVSEIASELDKRGVIRSKSVFLLYAYLSGDFKNLKPGTYFLTARMGMGEVLGQLKNGPNEVETTIYPGMTLWEIDNQLSDLGVIKKGELNDLKIWDFSIDFSFLKDSENLEGFLMPDTYRFYPQSDSKKVARVFLDNFKKKALPLLENKNLKNNLIIASLIEKEVSLPDDKKKVSGVIRNRLEIDMALQIDASVIYGSCQKKFEGCSLSSGDFKKDNPYNLYLYKGLPPTPISNPSLDSIRAALNPEKNNYFYYLSNRESGETIFSETFDVHSQNREKYLGL